MDDELLFGSPLYWLMLTLLVFARGMDFLSTWVATPNMVLEGNPLAKKMGWKWGVVLNIALCFGFAFWPPTAIIISTTSVLVAGRNFQNAWLMRSMGEEGYRAWYVQRMYECSLSLFLFCLFGQTLLIALTGGVLIYFSCDENATMMVPFSIGLGIVGYAFTVLFYTLLSVWRIRRSMRHFEN